MEEDRGDDRGKKRWKKVLYGGVQTGYEDNYTDTSFLEEMVMNANVRKRRTWTVTRDAVAVSQHVCVVGLVGTVWMHSLDGALDAWVLLELDILILVLGFATLFLTTNNLSSASFLQHHILNFSLFVTALYILAPIFQTLTRSISSDSIWTSTVCLLLVHLVFHDYTYTTMNPETMADDYMLGSPGTPLWATKQDVFQLAAMGLGFSVNGSLSSPGTPSLARKQDIFQPATVGIGFSANDVLGSPGTPSWATRQDVRFSANDLLGSPGSPQTPSQVSTREVLQPPVKEKAMGITLSPIDVIGSPRSPQTPSQDSLHEISQFEAQNSRNSPGTPRTPSEGSTQEDLPPAAKMALDITLPPIDMMGSPRSPKTPPQATRHEVAQFETQSNRKFLAYDELGSPGTPRTPSQGSTQAVMQPAAKRKAMDFAISPIDVVGSPGSSQTPSQASSHEVSQFAAWQKAKFSAYDILGSSGTPQTPSRAHESLQAGAKSNKKAMGITFSANVSLNASIVASVLIASRLPSRLLVFALMLFSLEFFLLFPLVTHCMRRRSVNFHLGFCCTLIGVTMGLIFPVSRLAFSLFVIVILFITLVCPYWLIRIQEYKFEINGPWDEAKLCFDVGD